MNSDQVRRIALKYALRNAVEHDGKANFKAVINKLFVEIPELKEYMQDTKKRTQLFSLIKEIVNYVNGMELETQIGMLEEAFGMTLEKIKEEKAKKTRKGLPDLPNASKGKVVTRFAPAPSGAIHLGQVLRAAYLSWYYAKKYDGKFIVRIEDTDPRRIRRVYYDWILEDLKKLGLNWDEVVYESDHFDMYYELTYKLFEKNLAYVCTCTREEFKKSVLSGKGCEDREKKDTVDYWEMMLSGKFREGQAVVRLKTDVSLRNPALVDPPLLRIIESVPHPRLGYKYRVYPLYNYACIIEDYKLGITHVIRAKEHETNKKIQRMIAKAFGWNVNITYIEYGMIKIVGAPVHKRDIRAALRRGELEGWDELGLVTIRALLKRGIHPDAIKMLAEHVGLTKHDIPALYLDTLYAYNAKILSKIAKRVFFVNDPILMRIKVYDELLTAENPWIPGDTSAGVREYHLMPEYSGDEKCLEVYVSKDDLDVFRSALQGGGLVRLKGLTNVKILDIDMEKSIIVAEQVKVDVLKGIEKVHWVPSGDLALSAFVIMPDGTRKTGVVEFLAQHLKEGDYIQMERFGFGKVLKNQGEVLYLSYAHA